MDRRHFLSALIGAPAIVAAVTACGDSSTVGSGTDGQPTTTPSSGPPASVTPPTSGAPGSTPPTGAVVDHPTGADDVVLRLGYRGGFVPVGTAFVDLPTLLIAGDGRLYRPGMQTMEFPGPLLPSITTATITEAGVQRVLALAVEHDLLTTPPDYSNTTMVADAPDTVVSITANGQTFEHVAPALGMVPSGEGDPAAETSEARRNLLEFVTAVGDLAGLVGADAIGPESMLAPASYRLQARSVLLSDFAGQEVEPTVVAWPATADVRLVDASECASTASPDVAAAFAAATSLTLFSEGELLYQLAVAPHLPGDAAC